ncbi:hypothetical protein QQ045_006746 [Rhodiola kirilowii]
MIPTDEKKTDGNPSMAIEEECNYGKGKWVTDESRPLYSGFKCKRWLSEMWACRLTQRTDFAYEKLRWQPKDCNREDFQGDKFLERFFKGIAFSIIFIIFTLSTFAFGIFAIVNRNPNSSNSSSCVKSTLAQSHNFEPLRRFASRAPNAVKSQMSRGPDVQDIGKQFGLVKARGSIRPDGWAYWFPSTNTTVLYYWSASLCDLTPIDPSNPKTEVAMHLDRPPAFLQQFLPRIDVLVLNTGHHWNRGISSMVIGTLVGAVIILPQCPIEGKEVLQDESSDSTAFRAVEATRVKLLDITAISQLRDEGHISRYSIKATPGVQDCLHWCLPGVPDTWNELLFAQI